MSKLWVEKGLGQITGGLETLIEPMATSRSNTVKESDGPFIPIFEDGGHPGSSYVL